MRVSYQVEIDYACEVDSAGVGSCVSDSLHRKDSPRPREVDLYHEIVYLGSHGWTQLLRNSCSQHEPVKGGTIREGDASVSRVFATSDDLLAARPPESHIAVFHGEILAVLLGLNRFWPSSENRP